MTPAYFAARLPQLATFLGVVWGGVVRVTARDSDGPTGRSATKLLRVLTRPTDRWSIASSASSALTLASLVALTLRAIAATPPLRWSWRRCAILIQAGAGRHRRAARAADTWVTATSRNRSRPCRLTVLDGACASRHVQRARARRAVDSAASRSRRSGHRPAAHWRYVRGAGARPPARRGRSRRRLVPDFGAAAIHMAHASSLRVGVIVMTRLSRMKHRRKRRIGPLASSQPPSSRRC